MKRVLVIAYNRLKHDARITRQLQFLKELEDISITVLCFGKADVSGISYVMVTPRIHPFLRQARKVIKLITRFHRGLEFKYFGEDQKLIDSIQPHELIIANDVETLPLAFKLAEKWGGSSRVVLDAHEYTPEQHTQDLRWRILYRPYFYYLCENFIPRVDAVFTVSKGIADLYRKNFSTEPIVIPNAIPYVDLEPSPVDGSIIKLVHHGVAVRNRALEKLIELMSYLDKRYYLHLILIPVQPAYYESLVKMAEQGAPERILFHEPVENERIPYFLNQFDIEVLLFDATNLNIRHTVPNKLFESVQSRLMFFTTPYSREVVEYVSNYRLGIVAEGFEVREAAMKLNNLSKEEIWQYKVNVDEKARELSVEKHKECFLEVIKKLLKQ